MIMKLSTLSLLALLIPYSHSIDQCKTANLSSRSLLLGQLPYRDNENVLVGSNLTRCTGLNTQTICCNKEVERAIGQLVDKGASDYDNIKKDYPYSLHEAKIDLTKNALEEKLLEKISYEATEKEIDQKLMNFLSFLSEANKSFYLHFTSSSMTKCLEQQNAFFEQLLCSSCAVNFSDSLEDSGLFVHLSHCTALFTSCGVVSKIEKTNAILVENLEKFLSFLSDTESKIAQSIPKLSTTESTPASFLQKEVEADGTVQETMDDSKNTKLEEIKKNLPSTGTDASQFCAFYITSLSPTKFLKTLQEQRNVIGSILQIVLESTEESKKNINESLKLAASVPLAQTTSGPTTSTSTTGPSTSSVPTDSAVNASNTSASTSSSSSTSSTSPNLTSSSSPVASSQSNQSTPSPSSSATITSASSTSDTSTTALPASTSTSASSTSPNDSSTSASSPSSTPSTDTSSKTNSAIQLLQIAALQKASLQLRDTTPTTAATDTSKTASEESTSEASPSTGDSFDVTQLNLSYGLLYSIYLADKDETHQEALLEHYNTFLRRLSLLEPATKENYFLSREYYASKSPQYDASNSPCTTTMGDVCFFPMDDTPNGTVEEISSGEYPVSLPGCVASKRFTKGWCWTSPPLTEKDLSEGQTRAFGECGTVCGRIDNANVFLGPVGFPEKTDTDGEGNGWGVAVYEYQTGRVESMEGLGSLGGDADDLPLRFDAAKGVELKETASLKQSSSSGMQNSASPYFSAMTLSFVLALVLSLVHVM